MPGERAALVPARELARQSHAPASLSSKAEIEQVARPAGGSPASRLRANSGPGEPPSPHADRQLPDRPPYTAFVGNVPYGCGPEDVYRIFEGLEVRAGPRRRRAGAGG